MFAVVLGNTDVRSVGLPCLVEFLLTYIIMLLTLSITDCDLFSHYQKEQLGFQTKA